MTCIVGVEWPGGVVLGGDRAAGRSHQVREPKVVRVQGESRHDVLVGFTTSFRMGELLRYRLKVPWNERGLAPHEWVSTELVDAVRKALREGGWLQKKDERELGGTFLVTYRGRLFQVFGNLQVTAVACGYDSCGSGSQLALGALASMAMAGQPESEMEARHRVEDALEAAACHDAFVRGPFDLLTQKREEEG